MLNIINILKDNTWQFHKVSLGSCDVEIPVCVIEGKQPGKTLLVTAGMDGDEYPGVVAVSKLQEEFGSGNFQGTLILIPVVNVPGYEAGISHNPLDGKFPKFTLPSRFFPTPTQRLMNFVYQNFVSRADIWMDLHSGSTNEHINDFVRTYKTQNEKVNEITELFHTLLPSQTVVYDLCTFTSISRFLSRNNTLYIINEAGDSGILSDEAVATHIDIVKVGMKTLNMINDSRMGNDKKNIIKKIQYIYAPSDGTWTPKNYPHSQLPTLAELGVFQPFNEIELLQLYSNYPSTPLYWKHAQQVKKGELLIALGIVEDRILDIGDGKKF